MSTTSVTADHPGNRHATPAVHEFDELAWLLGQLEDWLIHAAEATTADWHAFTGAGGPSIPDVIRMLGRWSVRMSDLAEGGS